MNDTHLMQMALGLTPPWTVTGADFDPDARRLDIHIDFPYRLSFRQPLRMPPVRRHRLPAP